MNIPFVDLKEQYNSIKEEILEAINKVLDRSSFIGGHFLEQFESNFARFCEVSHCIGTGNGTDALFISLKSLGVGKNDEVITAANTFIATSEAISLTGAKVVFCDVNENTYNINTDLIEEKITENTRAIIPVHLFGQPADMDKIIDIARKYNLFVIEDASQAHGARYENKRVGTIGNIGCFSFYPGKNLGAYGDGGAIVTNDAEIAKKVRMYANHGRLEKYNHEIEGVNSRLDGMQAAILSVKLKYLNEWNIKRNKKAEIYNEKLRDIEDIKTPVISNYRDHVFHLYVIRSKQRDRLKKFLEDNGIFCGIHYPIALPNLRAYRYLNHTPEDFPVSSMLQDEIISLPIYPELTEEKINYVVDTIRKFHSGV